MPPKAKRFGSYQAKCAVIVGHPAAELGTSIEGERGRGNFWRIRGLAEFGDVAKEFKS